MVKTVVAIISIGLCACGAESVDTSVTHAAQAAATDGTSFLRHRVRGLHLDIVEVSIADGHASTRDTINLATYGCRLSTANSFYSHSYDERLGVVFRCKLNDDRYTVVFVSWSELTGTFTFAEVYGPRHLRSVWYGPNHTVQWPRFVWRNSGDLVVSVAYIDTTSNQTPDQVPKTKVRFFTSSDAVDWAHHSDALPKEYYDQFPERSGYFHPQVIAMRPYDNLAMIVTEQYNRADQTRCGEWGDDYVVFAKSQMIEGAPVWPREIRWRSRKTELHRTQCRDNNEATVVATDDFELLAVFHSRDEIHDEYQFADGTTGRVKDGDLVSARSSDNGSTWHSVSVVEEGAYPRDLRKPVLYDVEDRVVLLYSERWYDDSTAGSAWHLETNRTLMRVLGPEDTWSEPIAVIIE